MANGLTRRYSKGHDEHLVASSLRARDGAKGVDSDATDTMVVTHSLRGEGFDASEDGTGRGTPLVPIHSAKGPSEQQTVVSGMAVRRLTPAECEKLQGFLPGYTKIPYRNKPAEQCPDGPRYRALGNSMAVPVMRWIGERIVAVCP